jgi:hypothetical protein
MKKKKIAVSENGDGTREWYEIVGKNVFTLASHFWPKVQEPPLFPMFLVFPRTPELSPKLEGRFLLFVSLAAFKESPRSAEPLLLLTYDLL